MPGRTVPARGETILLVDDQDALRKLAKAILKADGYQVLEASSGAEAIRLAAEEEGAVQLLITDVVMPGMNGVELADELKAKRPEVRVLYISGHSADTIVERGLDPGEGAFLQKPFSPRSLVAKARELLTVPSKPFTDDSL